MRSWKNVLRSILRDSKTKLGERKKLILIQYDDDGEYVVADCQEDL